MKPIITTFLFALIMVVKANATVFMANNRLPSVDQFIHINSAIVAAKEFIENGIFSFNSLSLKFK